MRTPSTRNTILTCIQLCLALLAASLLLSGCSSKARHTPANLTCIPRTYQPAPQDDYTYTLPPDDSLALSPAEQAAFLSTGDFDGNLTPTQKNEVLRFFKHYVHKERGTVTESVNRARLYMPYIRKILKERGLPGELAYLPFIESNYNVMVRSRSGALGMWQFMPATAADFGMARDSWIDERRDPYISTRAAASYFSQLKNCFDGDWHLAISAYNAGQGKIRRSLDAAGANTFFELREKSCYIRDPKLQMSAENRNYLPKFLAICKIMRNLKPLGFETVDARPGPNMVSVPIKPGTHLPSLASVSRMSWEQFLQYNAMYLRTYAPSGQHTVWVPAKQKRQITSWLNEQSDDFPYASWKPYTASPSDTIGSIAKRYGVAQDELCRVNCLSAASLKPGTTLLVPPNPAIPETQCAVPYHTRISPPKADIEAQKLASKLLASSSNSLSKTPSPSTPKASVSIARPSPLKSVDSRSVSKDPEKPQKSADSRNASKTPEKPAASKKNSKSRTPAIAQSPQPAPKSGPSTYRVKPGDTIWSIARQHNLSPHQLLSANGMNASNAHLHPGDTVKLR